MSERSAGGSQALHAHEPISPAVDAHEPIAPVVDAHEPIAPVVRPQEPISPAVDAHDATESEFVVNAIGATVARSGPAAPRSSRFDSPAHDAARARRSAARAGRARVALSVIVPLYDGAPCASEQIERIAAEARALVASCEILVVADARSRETAAALAVRLASSSDAPGASGAAQRTRESIAIYALSHETGESAALRTAFRLARGSYVVTMPAASIVAPGSLDRILGRLRAGAALVLGKRSPDVSARALPAPSFTERLLARVSGLPLSDLGCGVRGMARVVAKELADGGDLARFLPFLAHRNGHAITEVAVEPAAATQNGRHRGSHLHGLHDLFAVVFLLRFARAPLRLFGSVGAVTALAGALIAAGVTADRILNHTPLARRPILVFAVLLIVVGVQTIALGILGELTVFARARRHREYRVERVLR